MKLLRFLTLIGMALVLSNCMGQIIDNLTGEDDGVSASETVETLSAELRQIDDDGNVLVVIPVDAFTGTCLNFDDGTFNVYLNDTLVNTAGAESAATNYVSDNQQIATAYEQVEYNVASVANGDEITIEIITTQVNTDGSETCISASGTETTLTLSGLASIEDDSEAVLVSTVVE